MAGIGATIGGLAGAALGTALSPGIGTGIGSSLGSGAGQLIESGIQGAKSKSLMPPLADAERMRALDEARRKQRSIEAGMDAGTQLGMRENAQAMAATQRGIAQSTGGNISQTVAGLLGAQKLAGQNNNQILGQNFTKQTYFGNLQNEIAKEISQRTLDLLNYKQQQARLNQAQFAQEGYQNIQAGLGMMNTTGFKLPSFNSGVEKQNSVEQPITGSNNITESMTPMTGFSVPKNAFNTFDAIQAFSKGSSLLPSQMNVQYSNNAPAPTTNYLSDELTPITGVVLPSNSFKF